MNTSSSNNSVITRQAESETPHLVRQGFQYFMLLLVAVFFIAATTNANAAPRINTLEKSGLLAKFKESGVAIRGYDAVAYWTEGKPVEGSETFKVDWEGAAWHFASQANADLFKADPVKYAPQYGGYCAYGVAQDALVKIEPENWTIVEDKLYLNFNDGVQGKFDKDVLRFIKSADSKFEELLKKPL